MADARLRDLERRFRASGSVKDEAALLSARVQAGALQRDRLELAALLGHDAALASLGTSRSAPWSPDLQTPTSDAWGLARWGDEALHRFCVAWAHAASMRAPRRSGSPERVRSQVFAEALLVAPSPDLVARAAAAAPEFVAVMVGGDGSEFEDAWNATAHRISLAVLVVLADAVPIWADFFGSATQEVFTSLPGWYADELSCTFRAFLAPEGLEVPDVVAMVRSDLAPWALGHFDPVRERVLGQQKEPPG